MRTDLRMRLAVSVAGALMALPAVAAELIKVPDGVIVRSLFDWEGTTGLEATVGGLLRPGTRTPDGADFSFSLAALCGLPAYRTLTTAGPSSFVDLQNLCNAARPDAVTFALIADTQELHAEHAKTADLLADLADQYSDVEFVITAGDLVDNGDQAQWTRYRQIASEKYTYRLPIVPVLGNHEYFNDPDLSFFNRVYRTDQTSLGYYAIDLGPATLIVLNSNVDQMDEAARAAQTAWLEATLAGSQMQQAQGAQKPLLVTYHHPAYATGVGTIFIPVPPEYVKRYWLPLFERYGVKLVMNGHEHVYERLLINGVNYVNAGPAGGTFGRTKPFSPSYTTKLIKNTRTVTIVTVTRAGEVSLKTYSPDQGGALIDEHSF